MSHVEYKIGKIVSDFFLKMLVNICTISEKLCKFRLKKWNRILTFNTPHKLE